MRLFGILSFCRIFDRFGDKILDKKWGFGNKMIISGLFAGNSFFAHFLLFSQSMIKN